MENGKVKGNRKFFVASIFIPSTLRYGLYNSFLKFIESMEQSNRYKFSERADLFRLLQFFRVRSLNFSPKAATIIIIDIVTVSSP